MAKYTSEFKLEVAKYILEEKHSTVEASKKFNVPQVMAYRWFRKYEKDGVKSLIKSKNKKYSGEFKLNMIKYMHTNHLSPQEVSFKFSIPSTSVILKWERIYYEEGPQGLFKERRGRIKNMSSKSSKKKLSQETENDLIEEVQQLRMEVAYLKKLNALVQERVNRENLRKYKPSQN